MLTGAVITASVAVVVAVLTQVATSVRARTDRRYTARRLALREAQDAALAYRTALLLYGNALPKSIAAVEEGSLAEVPGILDNNRITAQGAFTVAISRVEDAHIALALERWAQTASRRFIDVKDVSANVEREWFTYANKLIAAALPRADCQTDKKARSNILEPAIPPGVTGGPADSLIDDAMGMPTLVNPSGGVLLRGTVDPASDKSDTKDEDRR